MQKISLTIRVDSSDVDLWKRKANLAGLNMSEWMRRACNEEGNGSASNQNLPGVPEVNSSGRRTSASERRSARRGNNRVTRIVDVANTTLRQSARTSKRNDANLERPDGIQSDSIISAIVTRENFAEVLATIPKDDIDRWARSLPREVLPSHSATSNRHTCLCTFCLEWRKANYIPYGGPVKKEKKEYKR